LGAPCGALYRLDTKTVREWLEKWRIFHMKKDQSSKSAEGVAYFRAIEEQRPVSERICYDPYARAFDTRCYLVFSLQTDD